MFGICVTSSGADLYIMMGMYSLYYKMDQQSSFKLSVAAAHHIQSFNYLIDSGLNKLLNRFTPMELNLTDLIGEHPSLKNLPFRSLKVTYSHFKIGQPYRFDDPTALLQEVYPQECRLAGKTYTANLVAQVTRDIDGSSDTFTADLGPIPIMVGSRSCHLSGMSR